MKAAVFHAPGQPLSIEQRPDPTPGPDDVVVRVCRCGVCGTDVQMTSGHGPAFPCDTVPGHEFAGEVVAVGARVTTLRPGDRITSMAYTGCGACAACRGGAPLLCAAMRGIEGGFAEYTLSPAAVCIRLPQSLSLADGALVEPLASALHAANLAGDLRGATVEVFGAGAMGLGAAFWARRLGAHAVTISARSDTARERAFAVGADRFIAATADPTMAADTPPQVVFECTGAPGLIARAIERVRPRGTVIVMGLCTGPDSFVPALAMMKEVRLQFAIGYALAELERAADVLAADASGALPAFVGEVVGLDALPAAFEALRGAPARGKLMVQPALG